MSTKRKQGDEDNSDGDSLVDIDFEFFDPNPIDYSALKNLANQLFLVDAEALNTGALADLILQQKLLGSTVKTDGKESDPLAYLSILNLHVHKDNPAIESLIAYVIAKSASNPALQSTLQTLLGPSSENTHAGYIFSERLINMPVQVVPPMYRMLKDEIEWANNENEPYKFSHYLFITRTFKPAEQDQDMEDAQPSKKQKKISKSGRAPEVMTFHPEDEVIQKYASFTLDYPFTNTQPREADSFGVDCAGRMMLVPADRFENLVKAMSETFAPPTPVSM